MRRLVPVLVAIGALVMGCGAPDPVGTGSGAGAAPAVREINVAAAADLRLAFGEIGVAYERDTGIHVTYSFGSSGQLRSQILQGAPFDVFASANIEFVDEVVAAGRADGPTRATYAFGRIVVFSPSKGPDAVTTLEGLASPRVAHVAIANAEHAPYGVAAEQALRGSGVHEAVSPKLVFGENVSDALRLATTGNADAAIVSLSLVATTDDGSWSLIDPALHAPLEQALVVTGVDPARTDAARRFAAYVNSPAGRAVMTRYGFLLPREAPA